MSDLSDPTRVIAASLLDTWVSRDWSDGLQLASLEDLTEIRVQTRHSLYEITVIDAAAGEILIRGGQFFPERTAARLAGSTLRGSFLKVGGIYAGFNLEVATDSQVVVTSTVQSVHIYPSLRQ